MRGKVRAEQDDKHGARITPAYAGKRPLYFCIVGIKRDHPRLCGEKLFGFGNSGFMMGSPPPMRGKVCGKNVGVYRSGITPAYAGKSRND